MFIMWYSVEAELQKSEERFDQVGCPGETGQPPPDLAEMFAAECKAGNDFACNMGKEEQESFLNQKNELVQWQFINVSELYRLSKLIDGAEIYSRINEVDDAGAYTNFVHRKAESILEKQTHQLLNLI